MEITKVEEEEKVSRGGINNYYYGGVQKVVNLTVDKNVFEKAVGAVVMSGGEIDIEDLLDIQMNKKSVNF